MPETTSGSARCPAAGSLRKCLNRAVHVIFLEFLRLEADVPVFDGLNCLALRAEWEHWCASLVLRVKKSAELFRFRSTLRSVRRCFDFPCSLCDKRAANAARSEWIERMGRERPIGSVSFARRPVWLLKERVRELTAGWGKLLASNREGKVATLGNVYVPDQQGCLETSRGFGGTLATADDDCHPDDVNVLRIGVAKTKGKHRVVTMQSARVKRILTPVHQALYDHISGFGWCVRGDVEKEDMEAVLSDVRTGEGVISGDYTAATDNISASAVRAIVEVLAESPDLTDEERSVLTRSFENIVYRTRSGRVGRILRGSMMGNLVSFPLLCLLNKACFDIACDVFYGRGERRVGRFNGDDCAFPGTRRFFDLWVEVTGVYGLIVNPSKTGFSSGTVELNSMSYSRSCLFRPKPCLSFLMPYRQDPECLLSSVLDGSRFFRASTRAWIVCVAMRYELSIRKPDLSGVSKKDFHWLLRYSWFRRWLRADEPPIKESGDKRTVEVAIGPPPAEVLYPMVEREVIELQKARNDFWTGRAFVRSRRGFACFPEAPPRHVRPYQRVLDRPEIHRLLKSPQPRPPFPPRFSLGPRFWSFVWPRSLLDELESVPGALLGPSEVLVHWLGCSPFLKVERVLQVSFPTAAPWKSRCFRPPLVDFALDPTTGVYHHLG